MQVAPTCLVQFSPAAESIIESSVGFKNTLETMKKLVENILKTGFLAVLGCFSPPQPISSPPWTCTAPPVSPTPAQMPLSVVVSIKNVKFRYHDKFDKDINACLDQLLPLQVEMSLHRLLKALRWGAQLENFFLAF